MIEAKNNVWYLQVVGDTAYEGSFREVVLYAVYRVGFKLSDIDSAVQDMAKNGHNAGALWCVQAVHLLIQSGFATDRESWISR